MDYALTIGAVGLQGEKGDKRDKGDKGDSGDPGPEGPPGISGYKVVTNSKDVGAGQLQAFVEVHCPAGKKVTGMRFSNGEPFGQADHLRLIDGNTGVRASFSSLVGAQEISAHAVCAYVN